MYVCVCVCVCVCVGVRGRGGEGLGGVHDVAQYSAVKERNHYC